MVTGNRIRVELPMVICAIRKAGDDNDERMIIYIEASNENADKEEERVLQEALMQSRDHFLREGFVSYDHLSKIEKDPKYIIGEPLDVKFSDGGHTYVKAVLYSHMDYAQEIYNLVLSGSTRVRASIGGNVEQKRGNEITKVLWDELAITVKPIGNQLKHASIMPFGVFAKSYIGGTLMELTKGLTKEMGDTLIPSDTTLLELKIPQEYEQSIYHVFNALILGKVRTRKDLIDYLQVLGRTELQCAEIVEICQKMSKEFEHFFTVKIK